MPRRKQPIGKCTFCGQELSKSGMTKHLDVCAKRKEVISKSTGTRKEKLYHLRAQDAGYGEFFLDLEVRGSTTLAELDDYLRCIWLECCGNMSQFSFGGWRGEELDMEDTIDQTFQEGEELTHLYDFGTTSETRIKVVGIREGSPTTKHPIALLARNLTPAAECMECEKPGAFLCQECQIEEDESGILCEEHAANHPHEDYGEPSELANSPRMGMCGYTGPANPPY
jgi:hypothetical protein